MSSWSALGGDRDASGRLARTWKRIFQVYPYTGIVLGGAKSLEVVGNSLCGGLRTGCQGQSAL